jgi:hypothetical protein
MAPPWTLPLIAPPDFSAGSGSGSGSGSGGGGATGTTFSVDPALVDGMKTAWADSFPNGRSQEQGGILVRKADGTTEWRAGAAGNTGSFQVDYSTVKSGETLLASGHTHPYDAWEKGHTDVPFSGPDLGNMALSSRPEDMKFVRSGDTVFMVQETQGFKDLVTAKGESALRTEMIGAWDTAFAGATGTFAERNEAAVKAVAEKYHLDFYKGTGDALSKVDTSK